MKKRDWISLVPHGWSHPHPWECADWSYGHMLWYMRLIEKDYPTMERGFKAPGWQISDGCLLALADHGWWVADQTYNNDRRPKNLRAYLLDEPGRMHFHIGSWNGQTMGNSLDKPEQQAILLGLQGQFQFVREVV